MLCSNWGTRQNSWPIYSDYCPAEINTKWQTKTLWQLWNKSALFLRQKLFYSRFTASQNKCEWKILFFKILFSMQILINQDSIILRWNPTTKKSLLFVFNHKHFHILVLVDFSSRKRKSLFQTGVNTYTQYWHSGSHLPKKVNFPFVKKNDYFEPLDCFCVWIVTFRWEPSLCMSIYVLQQGILWQCIQLWNKFCREMNLV